MRDVQCFLWFACSFPSPDVRDMKVEHCWSWVWISLWSLEKPVFMKVWWIEGQEKVRPLKARANNLQTVSSSNNRYNLSVVSNKRDQDSSEWNIRTKCYSKKMIHVFFIMPAGHIYSSHVGLHSLHQIFCKLRNWIYVAGAFLMKCNWILSMKRAVLLPSSSWSATAQ